MTKANSQRYIALEPSARLPPKGDLDKGNLHQLAAPNVPSNASFSAIGALKSKSSWCISIPASPRRMRMGELPLVAARRVFTSKLVHHLLNAVRRIALWRPDFSEQPYAGFHWGRLPG